MSMDKEKFSQTAEALEKLGQALAQLKQETEYKKSVYEQQKQTVDNGSAVCFDDWAGKISEIVKKIDMVLEEDGANSYHN